MNRSNSEILALAVSAAWRRRYLILLPVLIMPALGLVAGIFAPKAYEARMSILVQEPDKLNPILSDLAIGANLKERMPALLTLLKSKQVLSDILRDLGQIGPDSSPRDEEIRAGNLTAALSASLVGSEMIELKIRGPKAQGLAKTLGAVGARFIDHVVAPGRGAVEGSESFLEEQLAKRTAEMGLAEQAYADFKAMNADKLPALYTTNVTRLTAMQQSLEEKRIELATAEARFEDLRRRAATLNPVLGRLEEAIIQASGELSGLRARYTDEHSEVQAAERKLRRLEEQRAALLAAAKDQNGADMERLWNLAAGIATGGDKTNAPLLVAQMTQILEADGRRAALKKEVEQLAQGVDRLRGAMADFAPIEKQQQQLERTITSAREMHDMLAKRYEMARLTGSLGRYEAPERIKIIDAPRDPSAPVTPGAFLFVIGGLLGGLILGAGLAATFEILDPRLRRKRDFEQASGLPVLAILPALAGA